MRKPIALATVFLVLLAGCNDDDGTGTTTTSASSSFSGVAAGFDPDSIQFTASLRRFDACADVLAYFRAEALARVGPYGLDGGGGFYPLPFEGDVVEGPVAEATRDEGVATTTAGADFQEGTDFSGSNVQVAGVDEPDIIKTDGSRIVAIVNGRLSYVDVSNGSARVMGSVYLQGWNHRFFMDGDTAFVFAQGDGYAIPFPETDASRIAPYFGPKTLVFEVDLSDPDSPEVLRTMQIDGTFLSARAIDGTLRIIVSAYPSELPFVYPSNPSAEDFALEANKQVIEDSTIDAWLPNYTLVAGTEGEIISEGLLVECGQVHRPAEFAGFDTLSVVTVDMSGGLADPDGTGVVAQGETVYSSTEGLYVATNVWVPSDVWGTDVVRRIEEDYSTALHKFDLTGGGTEYVASGSVRGHLLNQFSMDEHEGFLRVATTDGPPWGFDDTSESFVSVLQVRDGELQQVGQVGDMGHGERIYSVRFIGDAGYVVTFRQVDPFYVLDLSDPEAPEVAGELKIAGYSGYLHPIGNDRILGIGQDATEDGFTTGAKVTMFDVSDPTNPRELGTWTMEGAYSDVEWDHLAFLFWPPEQIAVLPVQNWQTNFYGAVVLKTDDGVREYGRISHQGGEATTGVDSDCRQLTMDEILALDPEAEAPEDGLMVFVCGEDEDVSPGSDTSCESLPYDEVIALAAEDGIDLTAIMEEGDRLTVCYTDFYGYEYTSPILRSLVVGDQIWTLTYESLQANSIDDLDVEEFFDLSA